MALLPRYNERSWAIDVIVEINRYCSERFRAVRRAGGEYTLTGVSHSLFPDVLLFGDSGGTVVQQGWELKMPETPINDRALLEGAERKAQRLGLDSYVVWNAKDAALYVKEESGAFRCCDTWTSGDIRRRADVESHRGVWAVLARRIIDRVNELLEYGTVHGTRPEVAVSDNLLVDYVSHFEHRLADEVTRAVQRDATFSAELNVWWLVNKWEHPGCEPSQAIARVNLLNWMNRILFAHYMKRFHNAARRVESIVPGVSVDTAVEIFNGISESCDFMNVFRPAPGQHYVDSETWGGLVELNAFLNDVNIGSLKQETFQLVLERLLTNSRKRLAGQFATPRPLAELLVRLAIEDRTGPVIDPCCGSGTIARAAYDLKRSVGVEVTRALEGTWASDKFAFPLQLCSIALSDPKGMRKVVQTFQRDALTLTAGQRINFIDPESGTHVTRSLPLMHAVISNLPFVRFEDIQQLNPLSDELRQVLSPTSDLYAYLIVKLGDLLEVNGRMGVLCSNSWLGTEWGARFREVLMNRFNVLEVVTSGKGRWFSATDVVTTMLILEKRDEPASPEEKVFFDLTTVNIEHWESLPGGVEHLADTMWLGDTSDGNFVRQEYTSSELSNFWDVGIEWNACFADLHWVDEACSSLTPAHTLFEIHRGERRGWDQMFYPAAGHGIEQRYIRPVLKSPHNLTRLVESATSEAFCCSDDVSTLTNLGMSGTLAWIARFRGGTNGTGRPLPEALARPGCEWYEMRADTLADLVIPLNPDRRLCVYRLRERSFVSQRFIRFTGRQTDEIDLDLCHALMNSIVGIFLIEASGFGRGLGVLDLNASKLARHFHVLDPGRVSRTDRGRIVDAFQPLLERAVLGVPQELESQDRAHFDAVVLQAFGIGHLRRDIYESLKTLTAVRGAARE